MLRRRALLILQGGGALGAFQCGAYQALYPRLREAGYELAAVAGVSIGAVNAAIIAKHADQEDGGMAVLDDLWRSRLAVEPFPFFPARLWYWNCWNGLLTGLLQGNPSAHRPNYPAWSPLADPVRLYAAPYSSLPLERTLKEVFGEFAANAHSFPLLLVGATDVVDNRSAVFHSWQEAVRPIHIRASTAIPVLFPPVKIGGRHYWDGEFRPRSLVHDVLETLRLRPPDTDFEETLIIVVGMFKSDEQLPLSALHAQYRALLALLERKGEFDQEQAELINRHVEFVEKCAELARNEPASPLRDRIETEYRRLRAERTRKLRIVHVRRTPLAHEHISRDFDFSRRRMQALIDQGHACALDAWNEVQEVPAAA